jgi:pyruvate formate lyase activating enzyme
MKLLKGPHMEKQTEVEGKIFKIKRFSVHDGPGIRTAVFLKGCPLNCIWCHSPEGISSEISIWYNRNICIGCAQCVQACPENALQLIRDAELHITIDRKVCNVTGDCVKICPSNALQFTGSVATVSGLISEIEKDIPFYHASGGGVTLTGGEPLFQPDFSSEILKTCKKMKIHTVVESCLYCDTETINGLLPYVDLFIVDIKLSDPVQHEFYTGKKNDIIKENFRFLTKSGKALIVRIPLIKNITDTNTNLNEILNFVNATDDKITVEYISYNPLAENNYKKLGIPFLLKEN